MDSWNIGYWMSEFDISSSLAMIIYEASNSEKQFLLSVLDVVSLFMIFSTMSAFPIISLILSVAVSSSNVAARFSILCGTVDTLL